MPAVSLAIRSPTCGSPDPFMADPPQQIRVVAASSHANMGSHAGDVPVIEQMTSQGSEAPKIIRVMPSMARARS